MKCAVAVLLTRSQDFTKIRRWSQAVVKTQGIDRATGTQPVHDIRTFHFALTHPGEADDICHEHRQLCSLHLANIVDHQAGHQVFKPKSSCKPKILANCIFKWVASLVCNCILHQVRRICMQIFTDQWDGRSYGNVEGSFQTSDRSWKFLFRPKQNSNHAEMYLYPHK